MKVKMIDIADKFGVSIATVSRALNNTGFVKENLKEKICQFSVKHGHKIIKNSGLPKGSKVLVLLNKIDTYNNSVFLKIVSNGCKVFGGYCVAQEYQGEEEFVDIMNSAHRKYQVIILFGPLPSQVDLVKKIAKKTRIILYGGVEITGIYKISSDLNMLARIALEHLLHRGHRRILFYGRFGNLGGTVSAENIVHGALNHPYDDLLETATAVWKEWKSCAADLKIDVVSDCYGNPSAFEYALASGNYTGVICHENELLSHGYAKANELGLTPGKKLSFIKIGHAGTSSGFYPEPTTIDSNPAGVGKLAVDLLLAEDPPKQTNFKSEPFLVEGKSVFSLNCLKTRKNSFLGSKNKVDK